MQLTSLEGSMITFLVLYGGSNVKLLTRKHAWKHALKHSKIITLCWVRHDSDSESGDFILGIHMEVKLPNM